MLLSVAKERKANPKQLVFVDMLLKSALKERQVSTDPVSFFFKIQHKGLVSSICMSFVVCFRSWRTVWCSLWLDASSLPTVRAAFHCMPCEQIVKFHPPK